MNGGLSFNGFEELTQDETVATKGGCSTVSFSNASYLAMVNSVLSSSGLTVPASSSTTPLWYGLLSSTFTTSALTNLMNLIRRSNDLSTAD